MSKRARKKTGAKYTIAEHPVKLAVNVWLAASAAAVVSNGPAHSSPLTRDSSLQNAVSSGTTNVSHPWALLLEAHSSVV